MDILNIILSSKRTVFTPQSLSLLVPEQDRVALGRSLMYYAKKGDILNPRKGIYTKKIYNEQEMACALLKPSYISLEYVLSRAGVTFQFTEDITCISYQNRSIDVDNHTYVFRQINPMIWTNMLGIEQRDNIAIATPERAFLDMMYLSAGQCYFDNLHPLNYSQIKKLLPLYDNKKLTERVTELFATTR